MCLSIWQKQAEQIYSAQRNCRKTEYFKKYMEGILKTLVDRNLLEGVKGKGGGYKLTKEPKDYSLGEILRLTEGDLASVPCTSKTHENCNHMESCPSHPIWQQLDNLINNYLDSVTLANLLNNE